MQSTPQGGRKGRQIACGELVPKHGGWPDNRFPRTKLLGPCMLSDLPAREGRGVLGEGCGVRGLRRVLVHPTWGPQASESQVCHVPRALRRAVRHEQARGFSGSEGGKLWGRTSGTGGGGLALRLYPPV